MPRARMEMALLGVLSSCSPATPSPSPLSPPSAVAAAPSAAPQPSSTASAGVTEPSPKVQTAAAELDRLLDPSSYQSHTKALEPLGKLPTRDRFAPSRVAEVRAYAFGFSRDARAPACLLDATGAFCADVVTPGVTLSHEQRDELAAMVDGAKEVTVHEGPPGSGTSTRSHRPVTRCEFEPHHGFVFLDAQGRPVAELLLCFTCSEVVMKPPHAGFADHPVMMWPDERAAFMALCEELSLGGCFVGDDELMAQVHRYRRAREHR